MARFVLSLEDVTSDLKYLLTSGIVTETLTYHVPESGLSSLYLGALGLEDVYNYAMVQWFNLLEATPN